MEEVFKLVEVFLNLSLDLQLHSGPLELFHAFQGVQRADMESFIEKPRVPCVRCFGLAHIINLFTTQPFLLAVHRHVLIGNLVGDTALGGPLLVFLGRLARFVFDVELHSLREERSVLVHY